MSRIFITGSSDGLGLMTARLLAEQGHHVVLHARNAARQADARAALPQAEAVVLGDLSTLAAMHHVADQANALGRIDAVIHNVGIGYREPARVETTDGLSQLWAINVLAPYVLTALMHRPDRLVYLSSGMHLRGDAALTDPQWTTRPWDGSQAYADSKLHDVLLAFAVARLWPDVISNAVSPGWVPTRMGGSGANDDLAQAHLTQVWLATSHHEDTQQTAGFLYHKQPARLHPAARDEALQDRLVAICAQVSGVTLQ